MSMTIAATIVASSVITSPITPPTLGERCLEHDHRILSSLIDTVNMHEENTMCEHRVGTPDFPLLVTCFTKTSISFIAFKMAKTAADKWFLCEWIETQTEFMNPWNSQQ